MLYVAGPTGGDEHARRGHPERPERLGAVMDAVADLHLADELRRIDPDPADLGSIHRVHTVAHTERLIGLCAEGGGQIDADTYACPGSWEAAQRAAGAGLALIGALSARGDGIGLVAGRPPGHHATADRAMGFCLLNNVAIAAASLVARGERVAIVDWDVHHGNGTQAIFWDEPRVFYASTHQQGLYPGTGAVGETGGPAAPGSTVNVPLPAGATGDVLRRAFDEVIAPAVLRFAPTWILVSAGFDAHRDDPLAQLSLTAPDFAALAGTLAELAPRPGRLVFFLEGGYDLGALRKSVGAVLGHLLGCPGISAPESPSTGGPGGRWVLEAARVQSRFGA